MLIQLFPLRLHPTSVEAANRSFERRDTCESSCSDHPVLDSIFGDENKTSTVSLILILIFFVFVIGLVVILASYRGITYGPYEEHANDPSHHHTKPFLYAWTFPEARWLFGHSLRCFPHTFIATADRAGATDLERQETDLSPAARDGGAPSASAPSESVAPAGNVEATPEGFEQPEVGGNSSESTLPRG